MFYAACILLFGVFIGQEYKNIPPIKEGFTYVITAISSTSTQATPDSLLTKIYKLFFKNN